MDFFYDYAGNPYAVFYQKGTAHQRFYYLTNLQGDVIGMVNTSSQLVAEYDYDPYGNLISITGTTTGTPLAQEVHQVNPLRYRGYYLDQETGWYYLQSRYYDPMLGRFLNADSYVSTGQGFLGYNMFAYCGNDPCNYFDYGGSRFVGLGAQFELDVGGYTAGIEVVVYWDDDVCGDNEVVIAVYAYDGAAVSLSDIMTSSEYIIVVEKLCSAAATVATDGDMFTKAGLVALQQTLFGESELSISVVAVFGNDEFKSVYDYNGPFDSTTISAFHAKVTYSESPSCSTISVGYSSAKLPSLSFGQTKYRLLTSIEIS